MSSWSEILAERYENMADELGRMQSEAMNDLLEERLRTFEQEMREIAEIHAAKAEEKRNLAELEKELTRYDFSHTRDTEDDTE